MQNTHSVFKLRAGHHLWWHPPNNVDQTDLETFLNRLQDFQKFKKRVDLAILLEIWKVSAWISMEGLLKPFLYAILLVRMFAVDVIGIESYCHVKDETPTLSLSCRVHLGKQYDTGAPQLHSQRNLWKWKKSTQADNFAAIGSNRNMGPPHPAVITL